tara:strand:- start:234 stop:452 length:219 start_codon:yes stop_codon:yes gene_type:complete
MPKLKLRDSLAQLELTLDTVGAAELPSMPTIHMISLNRDEIQLAIAHGKKSDVFTLDSDQVKMLHAYLETLL